jgi:hypothetical protein
MKAVLHVGAARPWTAALGNSPWPLLPLGNRPLLEYWFEWSVDLGVTDVHLVLGDGAEQLEQYAGDGRRWGLRIHYAFLRDDRTPHSYLHRNPALWQDGLLFLSGPLFPRRLSDIRQKPKPPDGWYWQASAQGVCAALCPDGSTVACLLHDATSAAKPFAALDLELLPLESTQSFFDLNLQLAKGEMVRYLAPGYGAADGSCIGFNVILPPSAEVAHSVIIGNDCRIGPLTSIGPEVVVGHHVVIDRAAQLSHCVVLDGTYVGQQVEIRNKIANGGRLIDPADGEFVDLQDTWLLAGIQHRNQRLKPYPGLGWLVALLLLILHAPLLAICYGLIRWRKLGAFEPCTLYDWEKVYASHRFRATSAGYDVGLVRLFFALGLDLTPRLAGVVALRWWLCGQEPLRAPEDNALHAELAAYFPGVFSYATTRLDRAAYFPGVFSYATTRLDRAAPAAAAAAEARYYAHHRGLSENLRILRDTLKGRLVYLCFPS